MIVSVGASEAAVLIRPAALGPEWVSWYLWLSGLEPLRFRVLLVSVCRAPTLGTSLATLFSLAKRAHRFDQDMLDTPFRPPFFRAMSFPLAHGYLAHPTNNAS